MIYKNNNKHPDLSYNFYELKHVFQHGNGMSSFQACIHKIFRDVFLKMQPRISIHRKNASAF